MNECGVESRTLDEMQLEMCLQVKGIPLSSHSCHTLDVQS